MRSDVCAGISKINKVLNKQNLALVIYGRRRWYRTVKGMTLTANVTCMASVKYFHIQITCNLSIFLA